MNWINLLPEPWETATYYALATAGFALFHMAAIRFSSWRERRWLASCDEYWAGR